MDLFNRPRVGKARPGYIPLFDDATLRDEPTSESAVTPEERDSVLRQIGALTGGTLSRVGDTLAMPDDYFRGLISGSPGERVTGRDLLRKAGVVSDEDNWGNFIAGLGTEFLTGPLGFLSGPAKALTPAGKAAAKLAGPVGSLLDTAPTALTRKAISTGAAAAGDIPQVAKNTLSALQATGRKVSTLDPATVGRPLYGVRTARRAGTLDDLIRYSDDQQAAERAARELLGDKRLNELRNQPLAKTFGFGLPFQDPFVSGDWLGKGFGDKYADVLDTLGQAYRWSPIGRAMAAAFDNRVGGKIDPELQLTNIANWQARKVARGKAVSDHVLRMSRLYREHPEVFSEEGNRHLGRYIEGPAVRTQADIDYVESRPELKAYADWWATQRGESLSDAMRVGLNAAPLQDDYGIDYLPRAADAALEMASKQNRQLGRDLTAFSGDMLRRTDAMQVPGGRQTIIDLSRDPMMTRLRNGEISESDAAAYIQSHLNGIRPSGSPEVNATKALHIAQIMNRLPDEVVQRSPLFGQHPTDMIGSYMKTKAESAATAGVLQDSVASLAVNQPYTSVLGGRHISIKDALNRLGLKTYADDSGDDVFEMLGGSSRSLNPEVGAAQQMRERLANLTGRNADEINLSEFSIPEEHVERLLRARDAFENGEAAGALLKMLDHYTAAWRGAILTWPARAVRDLYSGAVSNWLEGAFSPDGIAAAKALLNEGPSSQRFLRTLRKIPRYQGDDGIHQFYADLAETGLLSSNSMTEIGASVRGQRSLDNIIGSDPTSVRAIGRELGSGWTWNNFWQWRSSLTPLAETTNPILRAGEKMNSLTDGINRLSGYLSLLKQGYDPKAAAARILRAQVDYSTLTGFEKTFLKRIFPWYSYQSRIFREVLRQLAERPGGRYAALIKGTESVQNESNDSYVTSGLRSQFAVPVPSAIEGIVPGEPGAGVTRYLTDLDFPGFDQINMIETPGTVAGTVAGTARQIGMQLHPLARIGVELMSGKDLFNNAPVGESTSALDVIARGITGDQNADVPAVIDKTIENLPFAGRPLNLVRSLADTSGDVPLLSRAGKTVFNGLTGMKLRDETRKKVISDATRQIEESIDPYTREFTQVYIPDHLQPRVPQWVLRRLAVARSLARERREINEKQRGGKKSKARARNTDTSAPSLFD